MLKHTRGFSWGSAGTSTAVWKGVPLHVVLENCGVGTWIFTGRLNTDEQSIV